MKKLQKFHITRQQQDEFALDSQRKTEIAINNDRFSVYQMNEMIELVEEITNKNIDPLVEQYNRNRNERSSSSITFKPTRRKKCP